MKKVKITAIRKIWHQDLSAKYENPIEHSCDIEEGQVFISCEGQKPKGLCDSAWESMQAFVTELANGGGNFFIDIRKRIEFLTQSAELLALAGSKALFDVVHGKAKPDEIVLRRALFFALITHRIL